MRSPPAPRWGPGVAFPADTGPTHAGHRATMFRMSARSGNTRVPPAGHFKFAARIVPATNAHGYRVSSQAPGSSNLAAVTRHQPGAPTRAPIADAGHQPNAPARAPTAGAPHQPDAPARAPIAGTPHQPDAPARAPIAGAPHRPDRAEQGTDRRRSTSDPTRSEGSHRRCPPINPAGTTNGSDYSHESYMSTHRHFRFPPKEPSLARWCEPEEPSLAHRVGASQKSPRWRVGLV